MTSTAQTSLTDRQTDRQTEYPAVDIIKFLCAYLVVAIHIAPLSSFSDVIYFKFINYGIQQYLARIAVPFYFSAAGFFLFRKIDLDHYDSSVIKKYLSKNLRLFGTWYILLFVGDKGHLWYMGGLVVAVCLLAILLYYKVPIRKMAILAVLLYAVGLIGDSYYGILNPLKSFAPINYAILAYDKIFWYTRNGIFMGFPFLLLGGIIEKYRQNIKPKTAFLGFAISMLLLLGEAILVKTLDLPKDYNMYAFLIPSIYFLMLFATGVKIESKEIYRKLRVVGIIVYFTHQFVYRWIWWGFSAIELMFNTDVSNSVLIYMLTIIISTCLGFVLEKLSHKEKLKFVKYLYS